MTRTIVIGAPLAATLATASTGASAQTLEKKNYNYSEWTK